MILLRNLFCLSVFALALAFSALLEAADPHALLSQGIATTRENGILDVEITDSDLKGRFTLRVGPAGRLEPAETVSCPNLVGGVPLGKAVFITSFSNIVALMPTAGNEKFFNLTIRILDSTRPGTTSELISQLLAIAKDAPGERGWHDVIETGHLFLRRMQSFRPDFCADLKVHVDADGFVYPGFLSI